MFIRSPNAGSWPPPRSLTGPGEETFFAEGVPVRALPVLRKRTRYSRDARAQMSAGTTVISCRADQIP